MSVNDLIVTIQIAAREIPGMTPERPAKLRSNQVTVLPFGEEGKSRRPDRQANSRWVEEGASLLREVVVTEFEDTS